VLSLLLLPLLGGSPPPNPTGTFDSTQVTLPSLPTSQVIGLDARRGVEEGLVIEGRRFAFEIDEDRLRVAAEPGAEPTERVRHGGTVELRWVEGGEPARREVRFERDDEGRWSWGPATARRFDLSGTPFYVIDVDLDGRYGDRGRDGWCTTLGAPLLPLGDHLNLRSRRLVLEDLAPDGSRLEARIVPLPGTSAQREALERLNLHRLGQGLPALELEPELSVGCSAHAEYLVANDWDGRTDPHDQAPRTPGATLEGRIAARVSWIRPLPLADAVEALCGSYPEAIALADPTLARIGLSDRDASPAVIDFSSRGTHRSDPTIRWRTTRLSPCDGSIYFPLRFPPDSPTEPLPGARRMGPPLLLFLADPKAEIADYRADLFLLGSPKATRLETIAIEDDDHPGILGALPKRPLKQNAAYRVVHHFVIDGAERKVSAVFRTK